MLVFWGTWLSLNPSYVYIKEEKPYNMAGGHMSVFKVRKSYKTHGGQMSFLEVKQVILSKWRTDVLWSGASDGKEGEGHMSFLHARRPSSHYVTVFAFNLFYAHYFGFVHSYLYFLNPLLLDFTCFYLKRTYFCYHTVNIL